MISNPSARTDTLGQKVDMHWKPESLECMACGGSRHVMHPIRFRGTSSAIMGCPTVKEIDMLGVRVDLRGHSNTAMFHRFTSENGPGSWGRAPQTNPELFCLLNQTTSVLILEGGFFPNSFKNQEEIPPLILIDFIMILS